MCIWHMRAVIFSSNGHIEVNESLFFYRRKSAQSNYAEFCAALKFFIPYLVYIFTGRYIDQKNSDAGCYLKRSYKMRRHYPVEPLLQKCVAPSTLACCTTTNAKYTKNASHCEVLFPYKYIPNRRKNFAPWPVCCKICNHSDPAHQSELEDCQI
jgi:hypothetical protein